MYQRAGEMMLVVVVSSLLVITMVQARYLPTREREDIHDLLKQLYEQGEVSDILSNQQLGGGGTAVAAPPYELDAENMVDGDGGEPLIVGSEMGNDISDEKMTADKRVSYQYICMSRRGRYRLCTKRYRRK